MRWEPQDIAVSKVRYEELDHLEEIFQREFGDEPNMETVRMRLKRMRSFYYLLLPLCHISPWVRERFNVYVIRLRDAFAGFLQLSLAGPRQLHLDFIAIASAYRGRGIGSYILRSLCNEFVDPKGYEMLLEVRMDNPARRLYAALGFGSVVRILHYERRFEEADAVRESKEQCVALRAPQREEEEEIEALCRENTPQRVEADVYKRQGMDQVQAEVENLLRQRHRIVGGKEDDFNVRNLTSLMEMMTETTGMITLLLGSIAAISLLVGGIGIMNIMIVSVTERTREIGIRKALGATYNNIMMQFLIESVVIGVIGGIIGVGFGCVAAKAISQFGGFNTVITAAPILLSFGFSVGIGLFFGIYPARKAALLDPIEALRYE